MTTSPDAVKTKAPVTVALGLSERAARAVSTALVAYSEGHDELADDDDEKIVLIESVVSEIAEQLGDTRP